MDDTRAGHSSIIVADTNDEAADIAGRCQQLLQRDGRLGDRVGELADTNAAHVGDIIQTRLNKSDLVGSDGHRVLNRDTWRVVVAAGDGSVIVRHTARAATVTIPADYLAAHVVLAYAATIGGAQGRTTDRGHVVVTPRTVASGLYVGMTRSRQCNTAYVVCDRHDHDGFGLGDRTAPQAFRVASQREPEHQLSATTVQERWTAGAAARAEARNLDRQRRRITDWWEHRQRSLPPRMTQRLEGHHHRVIAALERFTNDTGRRTAVNRSLSRIDWRRPRAVDEFLTLLARQPAIETAVPVAAGPHRERGAGRRS